jgi:hypothetical protein
MHEGKKGKKEYQKVIIFILHTFRIALHWPVPFLGAHISILSCLLSKASRRNDSAALSVKLVVANPFGAAPTRPIAIDRLRRGTDLLRNFSMKHLLTSPVLYSWSSFVNGLCNIDCVFTMQGVISPLICISLEEIYCTFFFLEANGMLVLSFF